MIYASGNPSFALTIRTIPSAANVMVRKSVGRAIAIWARASVNADPDSRSSLTESDLYGR